MSTMNKNILYAQTLSEHVESSFLSEEVLDATQEEYGEKIQDMLGDFEDMEQQYKKARDLYPEMLNLFMENKFESDTFTAFLRSLSMLAFRNSDIQNALMYTRYAYQVSKEQKEQYLAIHEYVTITSCVRCGDYEEHVAFLKTALVTLFSSVADRDFVRQFAMLYKHSTKDIRVTLIGVYQMQMKSRNEEYCTHAVLEILQSSGYGEIAKKLLRQ